MEGRSGGERLPLDQGCRAAQFEGQPIDEVTFLIEVILKLDVDGAEFLKGSEAARLQASPVLIVETANGYSRPDCSANVPSRDARGYPGRALRRGRISARR